MARKIKFALEMADGAKVRGNIDELREHFDIESAVRYFLSGKLIEWLDDRYYESEAEALEQIDKDSPDFHQKLCEALGVEYKTDDDLDVAALERLNEKKAILRQMTDDEEILRNADKTALTQEDLADLLDMGEDTIYLCGKKFNIPARVKNKKYIGILGIPDILVKVSSQEELDGKNIVFKNVHLPWEQAVVASKNLMDLNTEISLHAEVQYLDKIKEMFGISFPQYKDKPFPIWEVVTKSGNKKQVELTDEQKEIALKIACNSEYQEKDILYIKMKSDLSAGFAFTVNSFCYGGTELNKCVLYREIYSASNYYSNINITCKTGDKCSIETSHSVSGNGAWCLIEPSLISLESKSKKIVSFLNVVKNLYK